MKRHDTAPATTLTRSHGNGPHRFAARTARHLRWSNCRPFMWRGTGTARLRAGQERLDAHHLPFAALRAVAQRQSGEALILIPVVRRLICWRRRRRMKQPAALRQLDLAVAVGQQPVVPNALEPPWQDMQQEATREFRRVQSHDLGLRLLAVVLPGEVDVTVGEVQQPVVGDRHPMRVAAEVREHLLGPAERLLRVDHPVRLVRPTPFQNFS